MVKLPEFGVTLMRRGGHMHSDDPDQSDGVRRVYLTIGRAQSSMCGNKQQKKKIKMHEYMSIEPLL